MAKRKYQYIFPGSSLVKPHLEYAMISHSYDRNQTTANYFSTDSKRTETHSGEISHQTMVADGWRKTGHVSHKEGYSRYYQRPRKDVPAPRPETKSEPPQKEIAPRIARIIERLRAGERQAIKDLRRHGWLGNGSLRGANLASIDLQSIDLHKADLQEVVLRETNLLKAKLGQADLRGADLSGTNLKKANLDGAIFNEQTILPDNTQWTSETDMTCFTNPQHPHFWRPTPDHQGRLPWWARIIGGS